MAKITPGRTTHSYDGELVVFLIGMTINKPWRLAQWLLGFRLVLEKGNPAVVQYWRSIGTLYAYASDLDAEHRPAWTAFNKQARRVPGAVGSWHETYQVAGAESLYVGTPELGLAKFTERVPVTARGHSARERLEQATTRKEL